MQSWWLSLGAFWLALSIVTFATYGLDKRAARRGDSRVPERVLHLLAAAGGWPGAYAGQKFFRHKTAKPEFLRLFWLTGIVPIAGGALLLYLSWT